jgi:hypothetical protein
VFKPSAPPWLNSRLTAKNAKYAKTKVFILRVVAVLRRRKTQRHGGRELKKRAQDLPQSHKGAKHYWIFAIRSPKRTATLESFKTKATI